MSPFLEPTPRDFAHTNRSNPSICWGGKFEKHCIAGVSPARQNCLVGDSFIERLATRPDLLPLHHEYFPNWLNLGIGGDRAQHAQWRIDHGGFPDNPGRVLYMCGSNNIRSSNSKEASAIAHTILATITNIQSAHPSSELTVVGILPRENDAKCRAAEVINSILSYKLPASVNFIQPPKVLFSNGLPNDIYFETDNIHLNLCGYKVLLNSIRSQTSLKPDASPESMSFSSNPVLDCYAIGQLEYLGGRMHSSDGAMSQSRVRASLPVRLPTHFPAS